MPSTISISTVERVAAAKTGLELHYHTLIHEPTARKARRQLFEKDLAHQGLSYSKRQEANQTWLQAESDHLRQLRALKNTSLTRSAEAEVAIPGYEVVGLLGRGSFGTVRLIAERPAQPTAADSMD